jgi:hypothetical protein
MQTIYSNLGVDIFKENENYYLRYTSGTTFFDEKIHTIKITEGELNKIMTMDFLERQIYIMQSLNGREEK